MAAARGLKHCTKLYPFARVQIAQWLCGTIGTKKWNDNIYINKEVTQPSRLATDAIYPGKSKAIPQKEIVCRNMEMLGASLRRACNSNNHTILISNLLGKKHVL